MATRNFSDDYLLAVLRRPTPGVPPEDQQAIRDAAAERIEDYAEALKNLREYAQAQGIDTAAYPQGKPAAEMKQEIFKRIGGLAAFVHSYWTGQEVGPERTWGANLYEIIRTAPREARE